MHVGPVAGLGGVLKSPVECPQKTWCQPHYREAKQGAFPRCAPRRYSVRQRALYELCTSFAYMFTPRLERCTEVFYLQNVCHLSQ